MRLLDQLTEAFSRRVAQNASRRGFLARLGTAMTVGGTAAVLLPVDRRAAAAEPPAGMPPVDTSDDVEAADGPTDDPSNCEYWRYCGIDGYLCSCCGGGPSVCPPSSYASPTAWVGTCQNPADGLTYLIAYNDCCGVGDCNRCECWRSEGQTPVYRPQRNNDIIWCFGTPSMAYHCSVARIVGRAQ